MGALPEDAPVAEPARQDATPWQPWPFSLLLWGIPGTLISVWLWVESLEEDAAFIAAVAATFGALMFAVATIGVIAQGVRLGIAWSRQDERSS